MADVKTGETDYLVVGGGAMGLAFTDVMLRESDAHITIVDKRHAPGGHWNDAYPHVRLHQPSSYYGVCSAPLGRNNKDAAGPNKGYYELASGTDVAAYFHALMRDVFLPSGRVSYHPLSEHVSGGEIVSLLSGARQRVAIRRRLVDATMLQTSIPLTHERSFEVADGVTCVPPNHLPRLAPQYQRFTVIGGGKTAMDALTWLMANGASADAITWIAPRDSWLWNRSIAQPGLEFFGSSLGGVAKQYEILASAKSIDEIADGMEAANLWLRVDKNVRPQMMHGATISEAEMAYLRAIANIVRKGRVKRIKRDKIVLEQGDVRAAADTLYVDCTARALGGNVNDRTPVFAPDKISLQMVRTHQPTFSAALIGHIEATIADEVEKRALTRPTPMTDTVEDWVSAQFASISNQGAWAGNEGVSAWISGCRLDAYGSTIAQVQPDDAEKLAILGRIRANAGPAAMNLAKLSGALAVGK